MESVRNNEIRLLMLKFSAHITVAGHFRIFGEITKLKISSVTRGALIEKGRGLEWRDWAFENAGNYMKNSAKKCNEGKKGNNKRNININNIKINNLNRIKSIICKKMTSMQSVVQPRFRFTSTLDLILVRVVQTTGSPVAGWGRSQVYSKRLHECSKYSSKLSYNTKEKRG